MLVPGGVARPIRLHHLATAIGDGEILDIADPVSGASSAAGFQVDGITTATITWRVRIHPDLDWVNILAENISNATESTTATADGIYRITTLAAGTQLKAEITAFTTGIITVWALVTP
jgi:hypothetical protein